MDTSQGALGLPETGRGREWTIPGAFRGDTLVSRLAASRTVRGCLPAVPSPSMWHLEREPCPRHRRSHTPHPFSVSVALLQDALEPRARTHSPPSRRTDSFTLSDNSSLVPHPSSFQAVRAESGLNYRPGCITDSWYSYLPFICWLSGLPSTFMEPPSRHTLE